MKKLLLTTIAATLLLLTANLAFAETPKGFDKTVILSSMTATHFQVGNAKYYATMQSTAPYMVISSTGITITGVIDGRDISADGATLDALAGLGGSGVGYFTVSPSTGIDSGMLAAGVKIGTANVQATGEPSATTYWRGDGAWAEVAQSTATYWQTSTIDTAADFGGGTCVNIDTVTTGGSIAMVPQIEQTAYETITGNLTSLYRYRQPIIPEHTTTINGLALKTNRDTATQTLKVSICDSAMDVLVSSVAPIVPNINIDYPSTTLAAYTTYYIVIETVTIDTYWNFRHTSSEPYSPSNLQYADYAGGEWADAGTGHDIYFVLQSTAGLYTTPVIDGSSLWSDWGLFTTNDSAPEGSNIAYYVKTSTYSGGLASAVPVEITSGSAIASLVGPYAQLIVDLSRSDSAVDPIVNRLDTLYCADGSVKLTGANMTGPLSATTLTGTHYGDGSNITGVTATDADCRISTGTLLTMFTGVGASTATLRTDVTAAQSALTSVGASTAALRADLATVASTYLTQSSATANYACIAATNTWTQPQYFTDVTANKFYGDGSALTGIAVSGSPVSDSGTWTAEQSYSKDKVLLTDSYGNRWYVRVSPAGVLGTSLAYQGDFLVMGGSVTYVGGYTIHKFDESGDFVVMGISSSVPVMDILIVAGGGGGGSSSPTGVGGGGGAGGLIYVSSVALSTGTYTIVVGDGGAGGVENGTKGSDTTFASLYCAVGGGYGARYTLAGENGGDGGSGGGGGQNNGGYQAGGSSTTNQGCMGGAGYDSAGGGGGGAGAKGSAATPNNGGAGGVGLQYAISGAASYYGGGGGGGGFSGGGGSGGSGGTGGGGAGKADASAGGAGTDGTGGGGGGTRDGGTGGSGGSGVVIVRYRS